MSGGRRYNKAEFPEFEWDENNENKLWDRHAVSALEAEECFANRHSERRVDDNYLLLGRTSAGRRLLLVYERKSRARVRVYSARPMTASEKRAYQRGVRE